MGDGSLKEPNLSAFLSYLLDPNQDHGLNSKFLESFLTPVLKENKDKLKELLYEDNTRDLSNKNNFSVKLELELKVIVPLKNKKRRDIDLVLIITDEKGNKNEDLKKQYIVCVENKIKENAITKSTSEQLIDELDGIIDIQSEAGKSDSKIIMIFLTKEYSKNAKDSYNNFLVEIEKKENRKNIFSQHLIWSKNNDVKDKSIFDQLSKILDRENKGDLDPIHEYSKHTIKSLLNFISTGFKSISEETSVSRRTGPLEVQIDKKHLKGSSIPKLYKEIFKYLINESYIQKLDMPFDSGPERYVIAYKETKKHPNGRDFFSPINVGNYIIETSWQREYGLKLVEKICNKLEVYYKTIEW